MNFGENIMDEKECYNCKHVEFDIGLCTQYYCRFHEKLVKMDDMCDDWSESSIKSIEMIKVILLSALTHVPIKSKLMTYSTSKPFSIMLFLRISMALIVS